MTLPPNQDPSSAAAPHAALGLIESSSIARGIKAADAMVKKAPVRLLRCTHITPGKHITIISGGVDEVFEAMNVAGVITANNIIDQLFLPQIHLDALAAINNQCSQAPHQSIAILEFFSVASTIVAADAALKAADVVITEMKLASGLGGKGFFTISGELHMIEAAVSAGIRSIESGLYCAHEIIAAPHPELSAALMNR
jgi:microcompartment protein CcmL/EutN